MQNNLEISIVNKVFLTLCFFYYTNTFVLNTNWFLVVRIIYYSLPIIFIFKYARDIYCAYKKRSYMLYAISSMFLCLFSIIICFASLVINGSKDYSFFKICYIDEMWLIFKMLFLVLLCHAFFSVGKKAQAFADFFAYGMLIYILGTIFMLINHDFCTYWMGLLNDDIAGGYFGGADILDYRPTRVGFSGYTAGTTSLLCSFSLVLYLWEHETVKIKDIIICIILFVGSVFYGRTGGVTTVFLLLLIYLSRAGWNISFFCKSFATIICVVISVGCFLEISSNNLVVDVAYDWIMEPINSLTYSLTNGTEISLGASSDTLLKDMIFLPDEHQLLFGDGLFENTSGERYMNTDSGVMRRVLYFGALGLLAIYSMVIPMIMVVYKLYNNRDNRLLLSLLIIIFFIGEIKDNFLSVYFPVVIAWGTIKLLELE